MKRQPSQKIHPSTLGLLALASLMAGPLACGDDSANTDSATSSASATATATMTQGTASASEGGSTDAGSGSESASSSSGSATSSTSAGTTDSTSASTSATETTTAGESSSSGTTGAVSDGSTSDGDTTTGGGGCEIKCGNSDWSYVWIANSGQHTVSKIDTRTMTEVGRYYTRPDHQGSPSRTSVSIDGRAVVVANRHGGLTKIWARQDDCEDLNNNGKIDTSTGKDDLLPFGSDECLAWYTAFPTATTQRPVAWTSGVYNEETCQYEDQQIWAAASHGQGVNQPCTGANGIVVYRINGDTGAIDDTINLPQLTCGALGAYGAAVDTKNNVWFFIFGGGMIFKVDYETLEVETVNKGFYGITVDTKDRVWLDDGSRYDPVTKQWATQIGDLPPNGGSGVAVDLKGRVWHATAGGIGWLDSETMQVGGKVLLPINGLARGIGVDVDGYIWAVPLGSTVAYRIHPETFEIATYDGLNQPYTYSDMAGGQITNVVCPQ
ncbi:MAG: hypothetical protein H6711_24895 [Myxococcales bacterium]|nr:hypothetical protein [Myxococcales bacterium]